MALRNQGPPNHIGSVKFGPADLFIFAELWVEHERSHGHVKVQLPPAAVPPALESLLQEKMNALTVAKAPKPEWLSTLLSYRDLCTGYVFTLMLQIQMGSQSTCSL